MPVFRTAEDWSPEHVVKFWDWQSRQPRVQASYFSYQAGAAITNYLRLRGLLTGRILDYGCGPGYLVEQLARQGVEVWGADSSSESLTQARERCAAWPNFRGVFLIDTAGMLAINEMFDLIVCCETVEHLRETEARELYGKLRLLLRPGGRLLITTPFQEVLARQTSYCPFCDSEFHRWQHFRSLSRESLGSELLECGLEPEVVETVDIMRFDPTATLTQRPVVRRLINPLFRLALASFALVAPKVSRALELKLRTSPGQNLIAIATRR